MQIPDASLRIVISAPDKSMPLERDDVAFMLVQYENEDSEGEERVVRQSSAGGRGRRHHR